LYKEASDTLHAACSIVAQYENWNWHCWNQ
jgi:hypothetical protein